MKPITSLLKTLFFDYMSTNCCHDKITELFPKDIVDLHLSGGRYYQI